MPCVTHQPPLAVQAFLSPISVHRCVRRAGVNYGPEPLPIRQGSTPIAEIRAGLHRCVTVHVLMPRAPREHNVHPSSGVARNALNGRSSVKTFGIWLYGGLLSRLQLMACGARLAAAADGDANDRQARPLPSRRERGTGAIVHISRVKIVAMTRFRAVRTSLTSVSLDGMVRRVVAYNVAQRHEITISVPTRSKGIRYA